jgi:hypothetical protein
MHLGDTVEIGNSSLISFFSSENAILEKAYSRVK